MNHKIANFICENKGILNVGYITDSMEVRKELDDKQDLVKHLADMMVSCSESRKYYDTIILNYNQLSEIVTDPRFVSEDKTYEHYIRQNFNMVGVNVKESDDIRQIIDDRWTFNYEILNFKVELPIQNDGNHQINRLSLNAEERLAVIANNIVEVNSEYDDFVYIIDLNVKRADIGENANSSKEASYKQFLRILEKKLYEICTTILLQKGVPLESVMISINLPTLCYQKQNNPARDQSAFDALMVLSHSLPAAIGGVIFTFDDKLNLGNFASFLNNVHTMKVLSHYPTTFMTHEQIFLQLASQWKGQSNLYMSTLNTFLSISESLEAGLNGNYKEDKSKQSLITGVIEYGNTN